MKTLIIGYGSIGIRHSEILSECSHQVAVVSKRDISFKNHYSDLKIALKEFEPDYIIIANKNVEHIPTLKQLMEFGFNGKILIEKPLCKDLDLTLETYLENRNIFIGYNLRFHPIIQEARKILSNEEIVNVSLYTGSYLPSWRPGTDYTQSSSAEKESGGGVLRDLSHELDYLVWLFGMPTNGTALGGQFSELKITGDDVYAVLLSTPKCPVVTLNINFIDRDFKREFIVNTKSMTLKADLVKNTLKVNDETKLFSVTRNETYFNMHKNILSDVKVDACNFKEALNIMKLIFALEKSNETKSWFKMEQR